MNVRQVEERILEINGRQVEFEYRIGDIVTLDDRVIIRFRTADFPEDDPESGRNVMAYDETGEMLWRIPDYGFTSPGDDEETEVPQPYTGMGQEADGRIIVSEPFGFEFDLDPETGKISNPVFTK